MEPIHGYAAQPKEWHAGKSFGHLSKRAPEIFYNGNVPDIHKAMDSGSLARIADALEQIAENTDPIRSKEKVEKHRLKMDLEARKDKASDDAHEQLKAWNVSGKFWSKWWHVVYEALLSGKPIHDPGSLLESSHCRGLGKITREKMRLQISEWNAKK